MKFKILTNIFLIIFMALITSCSDSNKVKQNKNQQAITVSIPPVKFIAEKIGGDLYHYESLITENKSLHDFEPTAKDLVKLNKSKIYFTMGLPIENKITEKIFKNRKNRYINIAKNIKMAKIDDKSSISTSHDLEHNHSHHEDGKDVHIWLSTNNISIMAKSICSELQKLDVKNKNKYATNLTKFLLDLEKVKNSNHKLLAKFSGGKIIVFHSAFGYFLNEYNFTQLTVEDNTNHVTLSALKNIISETKKMKTKIIYSQPQYNKFNAKAISDATKCKIIIINPLAEDLFKNLAFMGKSFQKNFIKEDHSNATK